MKAPELWVIAGPNGAGKSTFVNTLLRRYLAHKIPFVNPDDIAAELDLKNRDTPAVQRRAGVQAIKDRNAHLANSRSFGIETTLSGKSTLNLMEKASAAGYRVKLVYIGVDDPYLSVFRVAARVSTGGHNVPADDALRRYPASLANLPKALLLADKSWVFDNTQESGRRLVLSRQGEKVRKVSRTLPEWASKAIPAPLRSFEGHRALKKPAQRAFFRLANGAGRSRPAGHYAELVKTKIIDPIDAAAAIAARHTASHIPRFAVFTS